MASSRTTPSGIETAGRTPIYIMVLLAGVGGSYWVNFVWFYLRFRWQTTPSTNLIFNAGFGLFYIAGCLFTGRIARRLGPRFMLLVGFSGLIVLTALSSQVNSANAMGAVILLHAFIITWTWPNLEMLMATGRRGAELSRAVSSYNIAWAGTSAAAAAIAGQLFELHHSTLFITPILFWLGAMVIVVRFIGAPRLIDHIDEPHSGSSISAPAADPKLAKLMKTLSRAGNMACYLLISSLVPLMPAITTNLGLNPAQSTAFGATWMVARVAAFVLMGRWHGWHYRIPLFLAVMLLLPVSFAGVVLSGSIWIAILAQLALGFGLGGIYTCSLYYSMHGKPETSEAAIHEAVIGFGIMIGPLISASAGFAGEKLGFSGTSSIVVAVITPLLLICGWMVLKIPPVAKAAA